MTSETNSAATDTAGEAVDEKTGDKHDETKRSKKRGVKIFIRDILLIFLAALLISFLIKTFLIRSFYIPSTSMEDTLHVNDRIIVNELVPEVVAINRGDVVVFRDPGGWLPPSVPKEQNPVAAAVDSALAFVGLSAPDSNDHLIKRVIGLPGDTVKCCNDFGQISVNGVPIDEPYILLPDGVTKATRDDFEVTVPEGDLWVMGDNRYNSADSAFHKNDPGKGFVPQSDVVGRALLISWPANRWAWLDDYPLVFEPVDKAAK
jgi:signal peptidase I